jgi:hypothetical protein
MQAAKIWPVLLSIILPGCGGSMWSDRASNPVIIDGQNPGSFNPSYYGVISTTAGRRSIFIGYKDSSGHPLDRPAICAEPPPDAIDALANAFTISASGKGTAVNPEAQAQLANSIAVSSALGLYRSQGLQLLRDQTFQLCIRAMVVHMDPNEWKTEQAALIDAALKLISAEMPAIATAAERWSNVVVNPPNPFGNGGSTGTAVSGAAPPASDPLTTPSTADKSKPKVTSRPDTTASMPGGYQGTFTFGPAK